MKETYVIKRNGKRVPFQEEKIRIAIGNANQEVPIMRRMSDAQMDAATENVTSQILSSEHEWHIEEIQDAVILAIQEMRAYEVATKYAVYRYKRGLSLITAPQSLQTSAFIPPSVQVGSVVSVVTFSWFCGSIGIVFSSVLAQFSHVKIMFPSFTNVASVFLTS